MPTDTVTLSSDATGLSGSAASPVLSASDRSTQEALPTIEDLRAAFMATPGSETWNKRLDLNKDGVVNFGDMAALRERMELAKPAPQPPVETEPTVEDVRDAFLSGAGDKQWNPNADLNGDGQVNFADLAALRESMAPAPAEPEVTLADIRDSFLANAQSDNWNPAADLDGDGNVNFADLAMLRARKSGEG